MVSNSKLLVLSPSSTKLGLLLKKWLSLNNLLLLVLSPSYIKLGLLLKTEVVVPQQPAAGGGAAAAAAAAGVSKAPAQGDGGNNPKVNWKKRAKRLQKSLAKLTAESDDGSQLKAVASNVPVPKAPTQVPPAPVQRSSFPMAAAGGGGAARSMPRIGTTIRCDNCGGVGHTSRQCPSPRAHAPSGGGYRVVYEQDHDDEYNDLFASARSLRSELEDEIPPPTGTLAVLDYLLDGDVCVEVSTQVRADAKRVSSERARFQQLHMNYFQADCGASDSMISMQLMEELLDVEGRSFPRGVVRVADGRPLRIVAMGSIKPYLNRVLVVEGLTNPILATRPLCQLGFKFVIEGDTMHMFDEEDNIVAQAEECGNLLFFPIKIFKPDFMHPSAVQVPVLDLPSENELTLANIQFMNSLANIHSFRDVSTADSRVLLEHYRCNHAPLKVMIEQKKAQVARYQDQVCSVQDLINYGKRHGGRIDCAVCFLGRAMRIPPFVTFEPTAQYSLGECIYVDNKGKYPAAADGERYCLLFVELISKMRSYIGRKKNQNWPASLTEFLRRERESRGKRKNAYPPRVLICDQDSTLNSAELRSICADQNPPITVLYSSIEKQEQNTINERTWGTDLDHLRVLLMASKNGISLWKDGLDHIAQHSYDYDIVPGTNLTARQMHEGVESRPDARMQHMWGCIAFVHCSQQDYRKDRRNTYIKFLGTGKPGIYIGQAERSKGHKVRLLKSQTVVEKFDVTFFESVRNIDALHVEDPQLCSEQLVLESRQFPNIVVSRGQGENVHFLTKKEIMEARKKGEPLSPEDFLFSPPDDDSSSPEPDMEDQLHEHVRKDPIDLSHLPVKGHYQLRSKGPVAFAVLGCLAVLVTYLYS